MVQEGCRISEDKTGTRNKDGQVAKTGPLFCFEKKKLSINTQLFLTSGKTQQCSTNVISLL